MLSDKVPIPVAPESRSADVVTGQREVADHSTTVRFREQGEFLDSTWIFGVGLFGRGCFLAELLLLLIL